MSSNSGEGELTTRKSVRKRKYKRLESWQKDKLYEHFNKGDYWPDRDTRKGLADKIKIDPRKVQIWFQNERAKQNISIRSPVVSEEKEKSSDQFRPSETAAIAILQSGARNQVGAMNQVNNQSYLISPLRMNHLMEDSNDAPMIPKAFSPLKMRDSSFSYSQSSQRTYPNVGKSQEFAISPSSAFVVFQEAHDRIAIQEEWQMEDDSMAIDESTAKEEDSVYASNPIQDPGNQFTTPRPIPQFFVSNEETQRALALGRVPGFPVTPPFFSPQTQSNMR